MKEELGSEWTHPKLFRMGASSLLGDIERQLYHQVREVLACCVLVPYMLVSGIFGKYCNGTRYTRCQCWIEAEVTTLLYSRFVGVKI